MGRYKKPPFLLLQHHRDDLILNAQAGREMGGEGVDQKRDFSNGLPYSLFFLSFDQVDMGYKKAILGCFR
jgi:hypothetical protein